MERSLSKLTRGTPGGHQLRREVVVRHQRERILVATVALVSERGYRAVSVAAIVKEAGVSRLKFYEYFGSKQDAFLAAFDEGLEEAAGRATAAAEGVDGGFPERVEAGVGALLDFLAERPDLARAAVLEAPALGSEIGGRRERALASFAPLLDGGEEAADGAALPAEIEETVLEGLYWLLYDAMLGGRPKSLAKLRPGLVEFALLPFLGAAGARAAAGS